MPSFFNDAPGRSGATPASAVAAPQSALAQAISGRSASEVQTLIRLLNARGQLSSTRRRYGGGGLFSDLGGQEQAPSSIGLGIEK